MTDLRFLKGTVLSFKPYFWILFHKSLARRLKFQFFLQKVSRRCITGKGKYSKSRINVLKSTSSASSLGTVAARLSPPIFFSYNIRSAAVSSGDDTFIVPDGVFLDTKYSLGSASNKVNLYPFFSCCSKRWWFDHYRICLWTLMCRSNIAAAFNKQT